MSPIIGVPAVLVMLLSALQTPPQSLGELGRREAVRRALTPAASHTLTDEDLGPQVPATEPQPLPAPATDQATPDAATPPAQPAHDEAWWQARVKDAHAALDRDSLLVTALQSRINALTTEEVNRDDPEQQLQLAKQRQQAIDALAEQKTLVAKDQDAIAAINEEARRLNVPPGWLRIGDGGGRP